MTNLLPGTLVRFVFHDEIYSHDFINSDLEEHENLQFDDMVGTLIEMGGTLIEMGLKVWHDLDSAKMMDKHWYNDSDIGNWSEVPFGTRGMIVDVWHGQNAWWYQILIKEKTVWTFGGNLVELPKPLNGDANE